MSKSERVAIRRGFWILPLLVITGHSLIAVLLLGLAVGAAHGCGRAIGIVFNARQITEACSTYSIMGWTSRWQYIDGVFLLTVAGFAVAYLLWILPSAGAETRLACWP